MLAGHDGCPQRRLLALVLLLGLIAVVPLAQASPPDPSWIPGIYDAADLDEVVVAVVSAMHAFEHAPLTAQQLDEVGTSIACRADNGEFLEVALSATQPRAPPG